MKIQERKQTSRSIGQIVERKVEGCYFSTMTTWENAVNSYLKLLRGLERRKQSSTVCFF